MPDAAIPATPIPLPTAAIARIAQDPASAAQLSPREAELVDMLARAGLAPELEPTATGPLSLLAATRPGRAALGS